MLLQAPSESTDLGLSVTGRESTLSLSSKLYFTSVMKFERSQELTPHLGVDEGSGELLDSLVPVNGWTLEAPKHHNQTMNGGYSEKSNKYW